MSDPGLTTSSADESRKGDFLLRTLPYIVVLALAFFGVAYTNILQQPIAGYWEFLALVTGVLCVISEWKNAKDRQGRLRLIWTQVLHWAAILITMNIVLLSGVQAALPRPATSLVLLTLLALGTFLAGVNFLSLQICFLGIAMALAVPAIAWLKQFTFFFILAAIFVIGLGVAFWPRRADERTTG